LGEATKIIGGKKLDPKGWNFSFALAFALLFAFSPCRSDHVPYATLATSTGDLLPAFFAFLIPLVVWNWLLLTFRDWAFFLLGFLILLMSFRRDGTSWLDDDDDKFFLDRDSICDDFPLRRFPFPMTSLFSTASLCDDFLSRVPRSPSSATVSSLLTTFSLDDFPLSTTTLF
jgi:hypothetical protein